MRVTEWDVNHALHVFFRHSEEYMLIFQDPDLHVYTDRHLIPLTSEKEGKKVNRRGAITKRGTRISVDPQKFRPDAALLDKRGQAHILEAKLGRINSKSDCTSLVVQALLYADIVLAPRWQCEDTPGKTYDLLEDIHEAFWFLKITDRSFGGYLPVVKHHKEHFGLSSSLSRRSFEQPPSVIFLLEDVHLDRLKEVCSAVKAAVTYEDFKTYAEQNLLASSPFRKRLKWFQKEWHDLRQTRFAIMQLDTSKFRAAISGQITPL